MNYLRCCFPCCYTATSATKDLETPKITQISPALKVHEISLKQLEGIKDPSSAHYRLTSTDIVSIKTALNEMPELTL